METKLVAEELGRGHREYGDKIRWQKSQGGGHREYGDKFRWQKSQGEVIETIETKVGGRRVRGRSSRR